ncbi:microfibril-associated glycoprotein 4-like [Clytia hemisphaerica]|uniref:Fibrinogen C-terminal domain-containing protein n=1 Tax=Clytia hemisphaerica TaxID=252671 RepID=A0A7M5UMK1_9CNID
MKLLLIAIFTVSLLTPLVEPSTDISVLKSQIQALSSKVSQQSQKIEQLEFLKTKDRVRNGFCQTKDGSCGSCFCVEDYDLVEKFYCDCRAKPVRRDCKDHYAQGERTNGLYRINKNMPGVVVQVNCDQQTDGGGWTLVQRRVDGSTNFQRSWGAYRQGFGRLYREFWLGNKNLYHLTAQAHWVGSEVRFDMIQKGGTKMWAKYSNFEVASEATGFVLHISGYSGNAGDGMSGHNGMKFTTFDRDNDKWTPGNCALTFYGAWWANACHGVHLNGAFDALQRYPSYHAVSWNHKSLRFSEIKVRRK